MDTKRVVRSGEALITLALFAALIGVMLALGSTGAQDLAYDLDSPAPEGLLALRLWLEKMGYRVERIDGPRFHFPTEADLLFVYPNRRPYSRHAARTLLRWVEAGGTLVLIGPEPEDTALMEAFGVVRRTRSELRPGFNPGARLRQQQPLFPDAPVIMGRLGFQPPLDLSAAPKAIPIVATNDGQVTIALQQVGQGLVWHLSTHHYLVNADLKDSVSQAAIVLALLRTVPPGGTIVFDTFHLAPSGAELAGERINSIQDWLYRTSAGWATLFGALTLFAFLVLQGMRLGPPLATRIEDRRREAAEYVEAMAALLRRARQRRAVAEYHRQRLKIDLGRPWHISPDLEDGEFLHRLQERDPHLDADRLETIRGLLAGLSGDPDEEALVQLVAKIDEVLGHDAG